MRILRPRATAQKVGYSDRWLRVLEARGEFPRRVRLGPNATGHYEHEVDEWLRSRAREPIAAE